MAAVEQQEQLEEEAPEDEEDANDLSASDGGESDGDSPHSPDESAWRSFPKDCLLGAKEDKRALADVIKRFQRDDLASSEDDVVAAIRMLVHPVSQVQHHMLTFFSCSLWLLFKAREDHGYCLLTRKGRVIYYGKGQEAQPDLVRKYLEKVLCNVFILLIAMYVLMATFASTAMDQGHRIFAAVAAVAAIVLIAVYTYAQRPRRDCGATYRQHFAVANLCAGTYARVDSRATSQCCARRRTGHLRLCFGRKYPDHEDLMEGLPVGTPDVDCVSVVSCFPAAMAAEQAMAQKDAVEADQITHGRRLGISARISSFLVVLGLVGTVHDYITFSFQAGLDQEVCVSKRPGCHWRAENPRWLGKQRVIPGAYPPMWASRSIGCGDNYEYCDYNYQTVDYCLPTSEGGSAIRMNLNCSDITHLKQVMKLNHEGGKRTYIATERATFNSFGSVVNPTAHDVTITRGMRLDSIGGEDSEWSAALSRQRPVHFQGIMTSCTMAYNGTMEFIFKEEPKRAGLYEEDCQELQEACQARVFGPQTFAFWPPWRFFNPNFDRTFCLYQAKVSNSSKAWHVLEQGGRNAEGLTCNGEPQLNLTLIGENATLKFCQRRCQNLIFCRYAFFGFAPGAGKVRRCLLYSECPRVEQTNPTLDFKKVECGKPCEEDNVTKCAAMHARFRSTDFSVMSTRGCRAACENRTEVDKLSICTAFAFSYDGLLKKNTCTVYGPAKMERPPHWEVLSLLYPPGTVGRPNSTGCFVRSFPAPSNRRLAGMRGTLLEYTNKQGCTGCFTRSASTFLLSPSNMASLLQNLMTVFGFFFIARVAHHAVHVGRVVFSGKPVVSMYIVQDAANKEDFDARERGYRTFLSRCFEVASSADAASGGRAHRRHGAGGGDFWEESRESRGSTEDIDAEPVSKKSFDRWELCNALRTRCFVDKELLGLVPGEAVRAAWSDTNRVGLGWPVSCSLLWLGVNVFVSVVLPTNIALETAKGQFMVFVAVLVVLWLYYYAELRREMQGLCVVTSRGRLLQVSRRPPPLLLPSLRGGTCVRLDSFYLGGIYMAQMDMPAKPLLADRLRAKGLVRAWRRGTVTVRGSKGLLAVRRRNGDILTVFRGLEELAFIRKTEGLGCVGAGGDELCGMCPSRDLFRDDERHVWERLFTSYGFFGDAFNYASLLTITDTRVLVTRARQPKDFTLRGLITGPLTLGRHCTTLQEYLGTNPFVTVTSVWNEGLESYATTRTRAPPFWPGFMQPVNSISVAFLGSYMISYPAGLFVTQRPYGIPRNIKIEGDVRLRSKDGILRICHSSQEGAPRMHVVVSITDPSGHELSLEDERWSQPHGCPVQRGSSLKLEAADPEWKGYADEPWLWQLRSVLDHVLGRSVAPPEAWMDLGMGEGAKPRPSCCRRLLGKLFGGDMLGEHAPVDNSEGESDEEASDERDPLIVP